MLAGWDSLWTGPCNSTVHSLCPALLEHLICEPLEVLFCFLTRNIWAVLCRAAWFLSRRYAGTAEQYLGISPPTYTSFFNFSLKGSHPVSFSHTKRSFVFHYDQVTKVNVSFKKKVGVDDGCSGGMWVKTFPQQTELQRKNPIILSSQFDNHALILIICSLFCFFFLICKKFWKSFKF